MSIQSVSQLTDQLRRMVERHFPFVWVRGEVGDLSRPASGHLYFTLKDEKSQLKAVMFSSNASRLRFMPENGASVICRGRISAYEKSGENVYVIKPLKPAENQRGGGK